MILSSGGSGGRGGGSGGGIVVASTEARPSSIIPHCLHASVSAQAKVVRMCAGQLALEGCAVPGQCVASIVTAACVPPACSRRGCRTAAELAQLVCASPPASGLEPAFGRSNTCSPQPSCAALPEAAAPALQVPGWPCAAAAAARSRGGGGRQVAGRRRRRAAGGWAVAATVGAAGGAQPMLLHHPRRRFGLRPSAGEKMPGLPPQLRNVHRCTLRGDTRRNEDHPPQLGG